MTITVLTDWERLPQDAHFVFWPGEDRPRSVWLTLTDDGLVDINLDDGLEGPPGQLRWRLPTGILPTAAEELVERLRPLLNRVYDGRDGRLASLTCDARAALTEIETAIAGADDIIATLDSWDPHDFLAEFASGERHRDADLEDLWAEARDQGIWLLGGRAALEAALEAALDGRRETEAD